MIDVFLRCGDVLQDILSAHRDGGTADLAASDEIVAQLEKFSDERVADQTILQIRVAAGTPFDQVAVHRALTGYGELVAETQGSAQQDWVYQLITHMDAAEILATLAFAIDPVRLQSSYTPEGTGYGVDKPVQAGPLQDGEGYGFFNDEPAAGSTATLQGGEGMGSLAMNPQPEVLPLPRAARGMVSLAMNPQPEGLPPSRMAKAMDSLRMYRPRLKALQGFRMVKVMVSSVRMSRPYLPSPEGKDMAFLLTPCRLQIPLQMVPVMVSLIPAPECRWPWRGLCRKRPWPLRWPVSLLPSANRWWPLRIPPSV